MIRAIQRNKYRTLYSTMGLTLRTEIVSTAPFVAEVGPKSSLKFWYQQLPDVKFRGSLTNLEEIVNVGNEFISVDMHKICVQYCCNSSSFFYKSVDLCQWLRVSCDWPCELFSCVQSPSKLASSSRLSSNSQRFTSVTQSLDVSRSASNPQRPEKPSE